MQNRQL